MSIQCQQIDIVVSKQQNGIRATTTFPNNESRNNQQNRNHTTQQKTEQTPTQYKQHHCEI